MANRFKTFFCGAAALLSAICLCDAQVGSPSPASGSSPADTLTITPTTEAQAKPAPSLPTASASAPDSPLMLVQASSAPASSPAAATTTTQTAAGPVEPDSVTETGGVGVREFQGDNVGQVLRLLARQAKINMVVSEAVTGTVTMRLEDVTALQAVAIIVKAKGLFMDQIDNVYYIKTGAERGAEPTESDSYQFSYSRAKETAPLIASQLSSKDAPQVDERTNTIFYRETRGNIDNIRKLLVQIDKPTKQVMIEARLVEVTANPRQSYGINWGGVVGNADSGKTFSYGSNTGNFEIPSTNNSLLGNFGSSLGAGFAILTAPQMSVTVRALNEDSDAEFLANPRIVTADNMQAKIEIIRAQPVPQFTFNEQTAQSVFGGFQDKKFGNTLIVKPLVNKDNFITLAVKPEISNKVGDQFVAIPGGDGGTIASPIIDTRSLDSNVLIKSGDTLAIGGLLQDEVTKARSKVPILGDIPVLGYFFQEKLNARTKRNLLVFVTPTIIDQNYGTGLEDQVSGLRHTGEEFADPNGWRNNAKGAVRLVPTSNRHIAADYPKPGTPPAPASSKTTTTTKKVQFMSSAKDREF